MANRALAAKAERAQRQGRELARVEYSKPLWARHETLGAANAKRQRLAEMLAGYTGVVTKCPTGRYVAPEGKGKRTRVERCYGDGKREFLRALVTCR